MSWLLDINTEWLVGILLNLFIKSTLITLIGLLMYKTLKKERPALQYSIWKGYCLVLLFLPLFSIDFLPNHTAQTASLNVVESLPLPYIETDLVTSASEVASSHISTFSPRFFSEPSFAKLLERQSDFFLILFAIGLTFFFLLIVVELIAILYISHQKEIDANSLWVERLNYFQDKLSLKRSIRLISSPYLKVPFTFGYRKPIIFVPDKWVESAKSEIDTILMHELGHIQRNDFVFNFLLQFHKCLYWWNPLVWLAAKKMQLACEQSCDEFVIRNGVSPLEYASQLLSIAKNIYSNSNALPTLKLNMIKKSELQERISTLVSLSKPYKRNKSKVLFIKQWGSLFLVLPVLVFSYKPNISNPDILDEAELYSTLSGSDTYAKVTSLRLLGEQERSSSFVLPIIVENLNDTDPSVRASAAWALGQFRDETVVNALVSLLNDESDVVREKALLSLGEIGEIDAFYQITNTHQNENPAVRKASLWALYKMGCIPAFNLVAKHLDDKDPEVRNLSKQLIERFDSEKMVDWLLDVDMKEHRDYVYQHFSEVKEQGLMNSLIDRIGEKQNLEIKLIQTINEVDDEYVIDYIQNILRSEVRS